MSNKIYTPIPFFDTLKETIELYQSIYSADKPRRYIKKRLQNCLQESNFDLPIFAVNDFEISIKFLHSYRGSKQTFDAYRRDIERFIQWSWFIKEKAILKLKRDDIEEFIEFCIKPHKRWIGLKKVARFESCLGERKPNSEWRPFEASISKKDIKSGKKQTKDDYLFSQESIKAMFAILSSFYKYCLQEELISANPVALIRQKSKFIRNEESTPVIRRLSEKQWKEVIGVAKTMALSDVKHQRTVFILSCLYAMYLRVSELTATERWLPKMNHFFSDTDGNWWFKTVGKGNKSRQIAVSDDMLSALKKYRAEYLGLPPYPCLSDNMALIGHLNNPHKPISDTHVIRKLVQQCFDVAITNLEISDHQEAENLRSATVHWLRHTGISEDVKRRPREHVRDDAGHSSGAITDHYIDVELSERAKSAKDKPIE